MTEPTLQFEEGRIDFVWQCYLCEKKQARGSIGYHLINHTERRCNMCAKCKRLADSVVRQENKKRVTADI